jgi:hypothetical protein
MILGWTHDASVDIWGLGVVLHMMLTGRVIAVHHRPDMPAKTLPQHPFLLTSGEGGIATMQKTIINPDKLVPLRLMNEADAEDLINFVSWRRFCH